MFLAILIFHPTRPFCTGYIAFAWAIAFTRWPIFKIVSFLEYLVLFPVVFLHRTTLVFLYNRFAHVFGHFNFSPNQTILHRVYSLCMGYSLYKMADFQNRLISRIFGSFSSSFFAQNNSSLLVQPFCTCFWPF